MARVKKSASLDAVTWLPPSLVTVARSTMASVRALLSLTPSARPMAAPLCTLTATLPATVQFWVSSSARTFSASSAVLLRFTEVVVPLLPRRASVTLPLDVAAAEPTPLKLLLSVDTAAPTATSTARVEALAAMSSVLALKSAS